MKYTYLNRVVVINESEGDKAKTTTRGLLSVKPKGIIVIIIYKLEYALK